MHGQRSSLESLQMKQIRENIQRKKLTKKRDLSPAMEPLKTTSISVLCWDFTKQGTLDLLFPLTFHKIMDLAQDLLPLFKYSDTPSQRSFCQENTA